MKDKIHTFWDKHGDNITFYASAVVIFGGSVLATVLLANKGRELEMAEREAQREFAEKRRADELAFYQMLIDTPPSNNK